jgi:hypothetical protein
MFKVQNAVKINKQTILQEQFDDNYEPTEDEVREYALYIGIDLDQVQRVAMQSIINSHALS